MARYREDRLLERACGGVIFEQRRVVDRDDFVRHPAREAVEKLGVAVYRLNVHACDEIDELATAEDRDGEADRHSGIYGEKGVSSEGRRLRPETLRLPASFLKWVGELLRAVEQKRKAIDARKRGLARLECYVQCLSDAELAARALLEGEPSEPSPARRET